MLLDMSRDDCKRMLRRIELEAYCGVITAFRAQGDLSKDKRKILEQLQHMLRYGIAGFPLLSWNLQKLEFCQFLFKPGNVPGILFNNRENLEFALQFNKIYQNLKFYIFKISNNPLTFGGYNFNRVEI